MAEIFSHKAFHKKLGRMIHPKTRRFAVEKQKKVKSNIADHNDTGEYFDSIKIFGGEVDWYVYSDDPNAKSKEYGHNTKTGGHVDGIHAFARAVLK